MTIALPAIAAEFRLGAVWLGWVTSAFLLAAAALRLPFGPLTDIVGRRRVFIAGLVVFTVATLLCAIAPSAEVLIALRLLQGAGGALIFGTGTAILTSVYPRARLGRALGIAVACVDLGLSLGPFVGGLLTAWVGWRGIFPFTASLAAGAAVLVAAYLRGEWAGVFPRRAPRVSRLRLFGENPVFVYSNLPRSSTTAPRSACLFCSASISNSFRGLAVEAAGLILVVQPAVQSLISSLAGWLSDRIEPRIVASVGMALVASGTFALTTLADTTPASRGSTESRRASSAPCGCSGRCSA